MKKQILIIFFALLNLSISYDTSVFKLIDADLYNKIKHSNESWLFLIGQDYDQWTQRSFEVYADLKKDFPELNLGYVDIYTRDGELLKIMFEQ